MSEEVETKKYATLAEAADYLGVTTRTVHRRARMYPIAHPSAHGVYLWDKLRQYASGSLNPQPAQIRRARRRVRKAREAS